MSTSCWTFAKTLLVSNAKTDPKAVLLLHRELEEPGQELNGCVTGASVDGLALADGSLDLRVRALTAVDVLSEYLLCHSHKLLAFQGHPTGNTSL